MADRAALTATYRREALSEAELKRLIRRLRRRPPRLVRFRTWLGQLIAPWLRDEGWD